LARLLSDLAGLDISEGALVNMLAAAGDAFKRQTSLIRARLLSGTAIQSDETSLRVGKQNWWLWVFHHQNSAIFIADPSRAESVPEAFLGGPRPDYWVSDRYGGQLGWASKDNQVCLAHLIRDAQYAIDAELGAAPRRTAPLNRATITLGQEHLVGNVDPFTLSA